jgi:hypothetical protein
MESQSAMVVLSEAPWGLSTLILSPEALSDSFAKLGKLLGSEHEESNSKHHSQMHGPKNSFKHKKPPLG